MGPPNHASTGGIGSTNLTSDVAWLGALVWPFTNKTDG